jgi:hypothetical protein
VALGLVVVVAGELLFHLLLLPGLNVILRVQKVPGRQDAGADQNQRKLASHAGHDSTWVRGA